MKKHGGDVIQFLGDAVLIVFPYEEMAPPEIARALVLLASLCALELVKECGEYVEGEGHAAVSLKLHCGVSCGLVHGMCLGATERWEYFMAGGPISQVGAVANDAGSGEVCVSAGAFELIRDDLEGKKSPNNNSYKLTGKRAPPKFHAQERGGGVTVRKQPSVVGNKALRHENSTRWKGVEQLVQEAEAGESGGVLVGGEITLKVYNTSTKETPMTSEKRKGGENLSEVGKLVSSKNVLDASIQPLSKLKPNFGSLRGVGFGSSKRNGFGTSMKYLKSTVGLGQGQEPEEKDNSQLVRGEEEGEQPKPLASLSAAFRTSLRMLSQKEEVHREVDEEKEEEDSKVPPIRGLIRQLSRALSFKGSVDNTRDPFRLLDNDASIVKAKSYLRDFLVADGRAVHDDPVLCDPNLCGVLKFFVHHAARAALESSGARYLFELRSVTTIFVQLFGLEGEFMEGSIQAPQKALEICLQCLDKFRGSLRQFTLDDKGCVLIGAFGLPGSSHEDNCRRAVETALAIRSKLLDFGVECRQGISEGRVFCGLVGCVERCEYAMMGASVNLAARLMTMGGAGEILVDASVHQSTESAFMFTAQPKMKAKGYSHPVAVYRPTERASSDALLGGNSSVEIEFVGRLLEKRTLCDAMTGWSMLSSPRAYLVDGLPGVGKTRLVAQALREAATIKGQPVKVAVAAATSTNTLVSYFVVRQLLEQIMRLPRENLLQNKDDSDGIPGHTTTRSGGAVSRSNSSDLDEIVREKVTTWVQLNVRQTYLREASLPTPIRNAGGRSLSKSNLRLVSMDCDVPFEDYTIQELIPLLSTVLGISIPGNSTIIGLEPEAKERLTEALVLRLILSSCASKQLEVIMVDNLQWCDRKSMSILERLVQQIQHTVFIGAIRLVDPGDTHFDGASTHHEVNVQGIEAVCKRIHLDPFSALEVKEVVTNVIGADLAGSNPSVLSESNIKRILERSSGRPSHAAVMAVGLKSAIKSGKFTDIQDLPAGNNNLVISRFDKLSKPDQLVVKIASVLGICFEETELAEVLVGLNLMKGPSAFVASLNNLVDSNLISREDSSSSYRFSDRSVQESIRSLMTAALRERVHGIYGALLEGKSVKDDHCFDDIVFHYTNSDDISKKMQYLKLAADRSLAAHEHQCEYKYLSQLVQLCAGCDSMTLLTRHSKVILGTPHSSGRSSFLPLILSRLLRVSRGTAAIADAPTNSDRAAALWSSKIKEHWLTMGDFGGGPVVVTMKGSRNVGSDQARTAVGCWLIKMGIAQWR